LEEEEKETFTMIFSQKRGLNFLWIDHPASACFLYKHLKARSLTVSQEPTRVPDHEPLKQSKSWFSSKLHKKLSDDLKGTLVKNK